MIKQRLALYYFETRAYITIQKKCDSGTRTRKFQFFQSTLFAVLIPHVRQRYARTDVDKGSNSTVETTILKFLRALFQNGMSN